MILRAEEAGYVPVLLIHDELLSEVPADSELTEAGLETIFRAPIPWLPGLALDAERPGMRYLCRFGDRKRRNAYTAAPLCYYRLPNERSF